MKKSIASLSLLMIMLMFISISCSDDKSTDFYDTNDSQEDGMSFDADWQADDSDAEENENWVLIFEDDFEQDSSIPDPDKWVLCPKGTVAWNKYMSGSYDQAYVEDGKLYLVGEKVNGVYKAGGIQMKTELGFKYGRVEVVAKFKKTAQGSWPAIWMMPAAPIWSGWPACGEIDIMEHLNNASTYWIALHSHYIDTLGKKSDPLSSINPGLKLSGYHTFALDWSEDRMIFYVDDQEKLTYPNLKLSNNNDVKQWPFDTTFYLILNNALGGEGTWPGAISDGQLPAVFEIDSVRVYQKESDADNSSVPQIKI